MDLQYFRTIVEKRFKSQKEAAEFLGMKKEKFSTLINGNYQGSFQDFENIVLKFGLSPNETYRLLTGTIVEDQDLKKVKEELEKSEYERRIAEARINALLHIDADTVLAHANPTSNAKHHGGIQPSRSAQSSKVVEHRTGSG